MNKPIVIVLFFSLCLIAYQAGAAVTPTALTYADRLTGTVSPAKTVTVSNKGTSVIMIAGITLGGANPGQYANTTTCPIGGAGLLPGESCTLSVRFKPTTVGLKDASIAVDFASPASSKIITLSGTGIAPLATVTPAALSYPDRLTGTSSAAQTVMVANQGTAPLKITGITMGGSYPGQFAKSTTCQIGGAGLPPGASCSISATFKPTTVGPKSASLVINFAAPASAKIVPLSGTGIAPLTAVTPTALTFADRVIGTSSPAKSVVVGNKGTAPLKFTGIVLGGANPGQFAMTTTCPIGGVGLAAGANCTVRVTFQPTTLGAKSASLAVNIAAPAKSKSVGLTGTGLAVPGNVEFPIATTPGREMSIGAAFDGTNYLVGIQDYVPDELHGGSISNIAAQLFSGSTGSLVGAPISIGRSGGAPSVAFDGTNYLLLWPDDATNPNDTLYGQRLATTGELLGSPFPVGQIGYVDGGPVMFDGANYFTVWEKRSDPNSGDTADIYGQFITPAGSLLGAAIPVSLAAHGQRMPTLSFDGTKILVTWIDGRNQRSCSTIGPDTTCFESDLYGQFIGKSSLATAGSRSGNNFLINGSALPRDNPHATSFDGTNYFVAFVEETTLPDGCPPSGCQWNLYGQFVTRAGVPTGPAITVSGTGNHFYPGVVWNGTKYLLTWTANFGTLTTSSKGAYLDASGNPIGSEMELFSAKADGSIPWATTPYLNGANYFMLLNRGIPGADPGNFDAYTNQDVFGSFVEP